MAFVRAFYLALLFAFLYVPLAVLAAYSFNDSALSATWKGFTWRWYEALFHDHQLWLTATRSAVTAVLTVTLTLPLAFSAALFFRQAGDGSGERPAPEQKAFLRLVVACLLLPDLVLGLGLLSLSSILGWPLGWLTLIASHVTFSLPFAFLVLRSRLSQEGLRLEEAAVDLGASPAQVFRRVTLPVAAPALWAAGFLVLTLSLDDVVVSFFTAGAATTTLPLHVQGLLRLGLQPKVNALFTVLMAMGILSGGIVFLFAKWLRRKRDLAPSIAVAFVALGLAACQKSPEKVLNVYNWPDYIDMDVVRDFEKETGVRVNYDTYASNEELVAKLQAGGSGYDVIFPSDYAVQQLSRQNLLKELRDSLIPNSKYLDPRFRHLAFDSANRFSIPFMWGTLGIAYNSKHIPRPPDSWNALFDSTYRDRIAMLNSHRDVIACALKALNHSMNSVDSAELAAARTLLLKQKPWVRLYSTEGYRSALVSEEVWIALAWPGDILQAAEENKALRYIVPGEGTNLWMDNMAIPQAAPHPETALRFIDFLLRPEIGLRLCRKIRYATPNLGAYHLLDTAEKANGTVYPPPEVLQKSEWFRELGEKAPLWDRVWAEVKG